MNQGHWCNVYKAYKWTTKGSMCDIGAIPTLCKVLATYKDQTGTIDEVLK